MNIGTRNKAKKSGKRYYYTGIPCKNNHIAVRQTANGCCTECQIKASRGYRNSYKDICENIPEVKLEPNTIIPIISRKDARLSGMKYYYTGKLCKHGHICNRYVVDGVCIMCCRRKSLVGSNKRARRSRPKWLSKVERSQIHQIYVETRRLSRETGIAHAVDHIVPLNGKNVCGLHVPWNLQILTKTENCSKGNELSNE